jgi:hypothetical protein
MITDLFVTDELGSVTGEILSPLLGKQISNHLLNALRAVKTYRLLVKEAKHKRKKLDKSKRTLDAEVDMEQRHKNVKSSYFTISVIDLLTLLVSSQHQCTTQTVFPTTRQTSTRISTYFITEYPKNILSYSPWSN